MPPTHRIYLGTVHILFKLYFTIDFGLCDRAFREVSLWRRNVIERAARSDGRQGWFMKWGKCSRLVCTDRTRYARYNSESMGYQDAHQACAFPLAKEATIEAATTVIHRVVLRSPVFGSELDIWS